MDLTSISSAFLPLQTTGLVGLAVSQNPHEVSVSLWTTMAFDYKFGTREVTQWMLWLESNSILISIENF